MARSAPVITNRKTAGAKKPPATVPVIMTASFNNPSGTSPSRPPVINQDVPPPEKPLAFRGDRDPGSSGQPGGGDGGGGDPDPDDEVFGSEDEEDDDEKETVESDEDSVKSIKKYDRFEHYARKCMDLRDDLKAKDALLQEFKEKFLLANEMLLSLNVRMNEAGKYVTIIPDEDINYIRGADNMYEPGPFSFQELPYPECDTWAEMRDKNFETKFGGNDWLSNNQRDRQRAAEGDAFDKKWQSVLQANWTELLRIAQVPRAAITVLTDSCNITSFQRLCSGTEESFTGYLDTIQRNRAFGITLPMETLSALKALRLWGKWYLWRKGQFPLAHRFTPAQSQIATDRYNFESKLPKSAQVNTADVPKYKDQQKWDVFSTKLSDYLQPIRGRLNLPLTYLLRSKTAVPKNTDRSDEERLMDEVIIDGNKVSTEVLMDIAQLWTVLNTATADTSSCSIVRKYHESSDGRTAWLTLLALGEGESDVVNRRIKAREVVYLTLNVNKKQPRQALTSFIDKLQRGFNDCERLDIPVPQWEQVAIMLRQIQHSTIYSACIPTIKASVELRTDFLQAISYLQNHLQEEAQQTTITRNIAAISTGNHKGNGSDGRLPPEEWRAMTKEQQDAHKAKMKAKRQNHGGNDKKRDGNTLSRSERKEKKKFKSHVAELTSLIEDAVKAKEPAVAAATSTASTNPSSQFGTQISAILTKALGKN
jgi:hypothetical protein